MTLWRDPNRLPCPFCKGKGVVKTIIYAPGTNRIMAEQNQPCYQCANSGTVSLREYKKMSGRD